MNLISPIQKHRKHPTEAVALQKTVICTRQLNWPEIPKPIIILFNLTLPRRKKTNLATHLVEYASFCSLLPQSEKREGDSGGNGSGVEVRDKRVVVEHGGSWRGSEREEGGGGGSEEGSGSEFEKKRGRRRKESKSRGRCLERRGRKISDSVNHLDCGAPKHDATGKHHESVVKWISCEPTRTTFDFSTFRVPF